MQSQIEFSKRPKLSEVMSPSELFNFAHFSHKKWQEERPLIDMFNHSELKVTLGLLSGEIDELNGGDTVGIFSKINIEDDHLLREDYRQQEVSDIVIFLMSIFDELGETINIESIYNRAEVLSGEHGFGLVSSDETTFSPKAMEDDQNITYGILKDGLNKYANIISQYDTRSRDRGHLINALEGILVHCVATHSLIGVNSAKAVLEKVERNHIKYPAFMFQLTEAEMLLSDDELKILYDERRAQCATDFDGPVMDIEVDDDTAPSGKNIIKERPKTGTTEFYSP